MQHAAPAHPPMSPSRYLLVYLFVCCCSLAFARHSMRPSVLQPRRRSRPCGFDESPPAAADVPDEDEADEDMPGSKRLCRYLDWDTSSKVF